jgi:hypothetical protein
VPAASVVLLPMPSIPTQKIAKDEDDLHEIAGSVQLAPTEL